MFEYLLVFIVVALAFWYVAQTLWKESKGNGCAGCKCTTQGNKAIDLIQIKTVKKK